ncbi:MAG: hypothetical protein IPK58_02600 [Acidobacteria bacterium]|nr:hypothetical protein [Acidobacteriota bacterium]
MFDTLSFTKKTMMNCRILFISTVALGSLIFGTSVFGQTPEPSPETINGYKIVSSIELGIRSLDVNGSINKFRSDLNYRNGFRIWDSSFRMENTTGRRRFLDTLQISSSGWGSDRSGFTRILADSPGLYTFTANFRRISLYNSLTNHALNQHNFNTNRDMGDFDLSVYPLGDKLKLSFGGSFENGSGPGTWTSRAYRDDFRVDVNNKTNAKDFRIGLDGKLFGFNIGLAHGYRLFKDNTQYFLAAPTVGNNTTDTTVINTFQRDFPTTGKSHFTTFNLQRTIAKRVDFTARAMYSSLSSDNGIVETITGRDNSNNWVDLDRFDISALVKRVQFRGDLGVTFNVTDDFRISNTFSFDRFGIDGGEYLAEQLFRRNAAGTTLPTTLTRSAAYRVTDYEKYLNTIEGDYQFNNRVSLHIGYRYTHRKIDLFGYNQTLTSAPSPTNPLFITEEESNSTNTLIAGMKIKPMKNWVLFWDVEHGSADNVFSRLENYKFTNFRIRSRWTFDKIGVNLSAISKDNSNPAESAIVGSFGADINSRIYAGSMDWTPITKVSISGGYTYTHMTSSTAIIIPVGTPIFTTTQNLRGFSQYYVRDHTVYFDVSAKPSKWVSFYATYRYNRDYGQRDRVSTVIQNIFTGYPMKMESPEFRASFRLHRRVDWNIGYQYFNYEDRFAPVQNYRAHLPYTSLRFYFGGSDR